MWEPKIKRSVSFSLALYYMHFPCIYSKYMCIWKKNEATGKYKSAKIKKRNWPLWTRFLCANWLHCYRLTLTLIWLFNWNWLHTNIFFRSARLRRRRRCCVQETASRRELNRVLNPYTGYDVARWMCM